MLRIKGLALPDPYPAGQCHIRPHLPGRAEVFVWGGAKAAQMPPNRDTGGIDALDLTPVDNQAIKDLVARFPDPAPDPVRHARQLAMPATVALLPGLRRSGAALQKHPVIPDLDRNPDLRCGSPVRVAFNTEINDLLTTLHTAWLTHQ